MNLFRLLCTVFLSSFFASQASTIDSLLDLINKGDIVRAKQMIASCDPNIRNNKGITPLMLASYRGLLEIVKIALAKNADTTLSTTGISGFNFGKHLSGKVTKVTALMLAAFTGKIDIVYALLKAGANPNAQDSLGQTALTYAILAHQEWPHNDLPEFRKKIIQMLTSFGADENLSDNNGLTPAYYLSQIEKDTY